LPCKGLVIYLNDLKSRSLTQLFNTIKGNNRNEITINVGLSKASEIDLGMVCRIIDLWRNNLKFNLGLIIENENHIKIADTLSEKIDINEIEYIPFFHNNISFFKQFVFIDKDSLNQSKLDHQDIFQKMLINTLFFGKLIILPNGDTFSNLNTPKIGNIISESINTLIDHEIKFGKNWRRTRKNIVPCKSCPYQYLCPSPSNYEYILNKNNLCFLS